jgi:ribosomal protein L11 methyltransferase
MIPYQSLRIYEIDGRIDENGRAFPPEYIGIWWEGDHSFVFFSRAREDIVQSILEDDPALHLVNRFTIDYRDWQAGDEIRSFRVGSLIFSPPWESVTPSKDDICVRLDPSVVFGTGLHQTTRACLNGLWMIYQQERPQRVIDLGTGTGILALACAKLGAQRILAVDHNPLAVKTTIRNVRLNGEDQRIQVVEGKAEDIIHETADLICGNLPFAVIDQLLNGTAFYEKRWMVLSGFFKGQAARVTERLESRHVRIDVIPTDGPWRTVTGFNPYPDSSGSVI